MKCLEKVLIAFHESKKYELITQQKKLGDDDDSVMETDDLEEQFELYAKIFCKLGHFNLLLEDYPKGM